MNTDMLKQLVTGEFSSCRTALALHKPHKFSRHSEQEPGMESGIRGWSRGSGIDTGKLGGWTINCSALSVFFKRCTSPWCLGMYYLSFTGDNYLRSLPKKK